LKDILLHQHAQGRPPRNFAGPLTCTTSGPLTRSDPALLDTAAQKPDAE
jgi:hypothetical protein